MRSHLAILFVVFSTLFACGGAVEFSVESTPTSTGDAASGQSHHTTLAQYDVYVDPLAGEMRYTPIANLSQLKSILLLGDRYISQVLGSGDIQIISGGTTNVFDSSDYKIRLAGYNNEGLCVKNINASGKHFDNFLIRANLFNPSSAYVTDPFLSDGQNGYVINFPKTPNLGTSCRDLSLTNTSASSYRFALNFEADLVTPAPSGYITKMSSTALVNDGTQITITGNGLDANGTPTVKIGGNTIATLDSTSSTQIKFTPTASMVGWTGTLTVTTGATTYSGPTVHWPTMMQSGMALPAGKSISNGRIFFRTGTSAFTVDAQGCPSSTGLEDTEILNNQSLDNTLATKAMSFVSTTGANRKFYVAVDYNGSGTLDTGDYYYWSESNDLQTGVINTPLNSQSIGFGTSHSCGLTTDGKVYCWGDNQVGQLGDGTNSQRLAPTQVTSLGSGVSALSVGSQHTCAIKNGGLWCWGVNGWGQIGDGTFSTRTTPVQVTNMTSGVTKVTAGATTTCALKNGTAYCWGSNQQGEIGDGTTSLRTTATQVSTLTSNVIDISAGAYSGASFVCAVDQGAAYCWGSNAFGQLGDGGTTNRSTPASVSGMSSGVAQISAGANHACLRKTNGGGAYCWGSNFYGQLGNGVTGTTSNTPVAVTNLSERVSKIAAGYETTFAIKDQGAWAWGRNVFGQLGDGTSTTRSTAVQVSSWTSGVSDVFPSRYQDFVCGNRNNALSCWGNNNNGQFGNGTGGLRAHPFAVTTISSSVTNFSSLSASCAVDGGVLKCWGINGFGEVGDGTASPRYAPVTVTNMTSGVTAVSAGYNFTCGLKSGGVKCWGTNNYGQLGDATTISHATAADVTGLTSGVTSLSASYYHACAIQSGAAYCWGFNSSGQLGDGTTTNIRTSPTAVSGLGSGMTAVSVGQVHSCGIQSGAAYCWGDNTFGQLGNGTTTLSSTPVAVTGLGSGVTAISAGAYGFTCAIVSGAAKCWGINGGGNLGDGTNTSRTTPVQVSGLTSGVTAITTNSYGGCAVQAGNIYCWGYVATGDGTTVNRYTPVAVEGFNQGDATLLSLNSAGPYCAYRASQMYCWGAVGDYSGNNEPTLFSTPTAVSGSLDLPGVNINLVNTITGVTCP